MKFTLSEFIDEACVLFDIDARTNSEVIAQMTAALYEAHPELSDALSMPQALELLQERERLAATGVGNGVAIPHASTAAITRPLGAFARSSEEVEFDAVDGRGCRLFFLLLSPANSPVLHIKALSRISRLMASVETRELLLGASDADAIYRILVQADVRYLRAQKDASS